MQKTRFSIYFSLRDIVLIKKQCSYFCTEISRKITHTSNPRFSRKQTSFYDIDKLKYALESYDLDLVSCKKSKGCSV